MNSTPTRTFTMRIVGNQTEAATRARALIVDSFEKRLKAYPTVAHKHYLVIETLVGQTPVMAACASISFAADQRLFSEIYFANSVESEVQRRLNIGCARKGFCEIGSLSTDPRFIGSVKHVVAYFPWFAYRMGFTFALVTVTSYMRIAFVQAGVNFEAICRADREKLPPLERSRWGNYYNYDPQAGAIDLRRLDFLDEVVTSSEQPGEFAIELGCFGKVEACS